MGMICFQSVPHRLIEGVQSEVAYGQQPGANQQSGECRLHSALRVCTGNWLPEMMIA